MPATQAMHGFLTRDGVVPSEFRRISREQLTRYENVRLESATVSSVSCRVDGGFTVTLEGGRTCSSRKLLLATGVVDNMPDLPGLTDCTAGACFTARSATAGRSATRPSPSTAATNARFGLSMELLGWSKDIVVCTDGPSGIDAEDLATLARNGIRVREERVVRLEGRDGKIEQVVFADGAPLACQALFFTTGQHQSCEFAKSIGCQFNEKGTVHTGRHESTRRPRPVRRRRCVARRAVGRHCRRRRRGSGVRDHAGPDQRVVAIVEILFLNFTPPSNIQ